MPGGDIEQRQGAEHIAALRLALHALAEPQERRPLRKQQRRLFNQRGVNARQRRGALRCGGGNLRFDIVETKNMLRDKGAVEKAHLLDDMQQAKGQRRIAARAQLQVNVGHLRRAGGDGIDDHEHGPRGFHPARVNVRRAVRRVCAPDHQAAGVGNLLWVKA